MIKSLCQFCSDNKFGFPPSSGTAVAEYLCFLADRSSRPNSSIKCALAAISCMYDGLHMENPAKCVVVQKLVTALTKTSTDAPMERTPILPIEPFVLMFKEWAENDMLPIADLRLKVITLMALTLMLRPSDIAPRSVHYDSSSDTTTHTTFSRDQLRFREDGSVDVVFHGIKNDTDRKGFQCSMFPHQDRKLDPVGALEVYLHRTGLQLPKGEAVRPVFLSLNRPFHAISADTIGSILKEAITRAGLGSKGFTAKSFRPTGAQAAVDLGVDPKTAQQMGRWKTESVFFSHYVHAKPSSDYSNRLLDCS